MSIALFDFSLFTIVVSIGLVAVALANPSPLPPETGWDGIAGNLLAAQAPPAPGADSSNEHLIIEPQQAATGGHG